MKILFLAHRVPFPPDKGDRIRSYNIIKFLARSHSILLMATTHEPVHPNAHAALSRYCSEVDIFKINYNLRKLQSCFYLFTKRPLTLPAFYSRKFRSAVRDRLRTTEFDLIYVYSSQMAQYVLDIHSVPKLMDFIDVDSQKWLDYAAQSRQPMKAIYYREGVTLRSFEKRVALSCNQNLFAAQREATLFKQIAPETASMVVPNGVDLNSGPGNSYRQNKIVFVGAMDYFPNVDAMLYFTCEILPLVQKSVPDVQLFIVGANPSRQIKALAQKNNVVVTSYVDEVAPYLCDAAASVVPLRIARGVQHKVLEAMAHGVPVITTTAALNGIEANPGSDILVADDPHSFAEKTVAVLKDRKLRHMLAANALALIQAKYSWEMRLKPLEESITQICRK